MGGTAAILCHVIYRMCFCCDRPWLLQLTLCNTVYSKLSCIATHQFMTEYFLLNKISKQIYIFQSQCNNYIHQCLSYFLSAQRFSYIQLPCSSLKFHVLNYNNYLDFWYRFLLCRAFKNRDSEWRGAAKLNWSWAPETFMLPLFVWYWETVYGWSVYCKFLVMQPYRNSDII